MKIIINGGGIAGFALARFLVGRGIEAVVLERAPAFSALGHIIALKADGVDVLDRLGIRADCNARALPGITDLNFATAGGYPLRAQPLVGIDAALHGFLALRRADLHAALHARVKDDVDIRFGRQVDTFTEDPGGVAVTLSDGTTLRGDALIGADGVHSVIRRRLFGDAGERPLGGSYVALEVELPQDVPPGSLHCLLGRGRQVAVIPVSERRLLGIVYHGGASLRAELRSPLAARLFFAREYADFAPLARSMFAAIDDHSFVYTDDITMITLPTLGRGRVTLLGDAGACPTFLSGMGSAHAMLAAEKLAEHLAAAPADIPAALEHYSAQALPMARALQANALKAARFVLGRGHLLAAARNAVLALTPRSLALGQLRRYYKRGMPAEHPAAHP